MSVLVPLLLGVTSRALAKDTPKYIGTERIWQELVEEYGPYRGVKLEYEKEITLEFSAHGDVRSRTIQREIIAVFDAEKLGILERIYHMPPGTKVKKLESWAHELDSGREVTWSDDSDVHEIDMLGGWKELRISIPGIASQGVFGITLETTHDGVGVSWEDFVDRIPVVRGEFSFIVPDIGDREFPAMLATMSRFFNILVRGQVEEVPAAVKSQGFVRAWKVQDLPARPPDPFALASKGPQAEVFLIPRWYKWDRWVEILSEVTDDFEAPSGVVASIRDTLASGDPGVVLASVACWLDNPGTYRLLGPARGMSLAVQEAQKALRFHAGNSLTKAVIAHVVLEELGVENYLVLAASRYHTALDWRISLPSLMDAVLLWIPEGNLLWDVADRSVPLGVAGPDLYPEMLLISRNPDRALGAVDIPDLEAIDMEVCELTLASDGGLTGTLACAYTGWPAGAPDPWDVNVDLCEAIAGSFPSECRFRDAVWAYRDDRLSRSPVDTVSIATCSIEREATPSGLSGWDVRPFLRSLPSSFGRYSRQAPRWPLYFDRSSCFTDSVIVAVEGGTVTGFEAQYMNRYAGTFSCRFEYSEGKAIAVRTLLFKPKAISKSHLREVQDLCEAWEKSQDLVIHVE